MQGFDFGFERGRMYPNQGNMVRGSEYQKLDKAQGKVFTSRNYDSYYFHFGAVKERLAPGSCCQRDYSEVEVQFIRGGKRRVPKLHPVKGNKLWLRRFQSRERKDSIESDHTSSTTETEEGLDESVSSSCASLSPPLSDCDLTTDMVENVCIAAVTTSL